MQDSDKQRATMCLACKDKNEQSYSPIFDLSFTKGSVDTALQPSSAPAGTGSPQPASPDVTGEERSSGEPQIPSGGLQPDTDVGDTKGAMAEESHPSDIKVLDNTSGATADSTSEEVEETAIRAEHTNKDLLAGHSYCHAMILYRPTPEVETEKPGVDVVSKTLDRVCDHIASLQTRVAAFETRMDRLEELLCRALGIPHDMAQDKSS